MLEPIEITKSLQTEPFARVLTPAALDFVAHLCDRFRPRVEALLSARKERQATFARGQKPDFLPIQEDQAPWNIAPIPSDLLQRKVEITGPVERKMIINALNSGADVFMADFEDSLSPTWRNVIEGQANLQEAVRRTIRYVAPDTGKVYELNGTIATLMVRPRGWHMLEKHALIGKRPIAAALFDFGLFFFHNAQAQLQRGTGPYFYLPKLQAHTEARLWNDIFNWSQEMLGIAPGTIRATCLIETLPAAFEMEQILYELRDHSAGLNCGRWDYIFSAIKTLRHDPAFVLPDRAQVGMTQPFLRAYTQRLIQICHRHGAHAMGGMAAQIPIKNNPEKNQIALDKVRADKLREVQDGHDGTWVAHPALVPVAREVFDAHLPTQNQIHRPVSDIHITREDLLQVPTGTRTESGLRQNVSVGVEYLESWLRGQGCVPLNHLMEDLATAEISRSQVWQWIHHNAGLEDGRKVTADLFETILDEELQKLQHVLGAERYRESQFATAAAIFTRISTQADYEEFLTFSAYEVLLQVER